MLIRVSLVTTYPRSPARAFFAIGKSLLVPGAMVPWIVPDVVTVSPSVPEIPGVMEPLTEPLPSPPLEPPEPPAVPPTVPEIDG